MQTEGADVGAGAGADVGAGAGAGAAPAVSGMGEVVSSRLQGSLDPTHVSTKKAGPVHHPGW